MSSEILGSAENVLKGNLGGAWDAKHGYANAYTDLGIAGKFGGASAAYSLRDIGAMNNPVVNVRRSPHDSTDAIDDEQQFSANQVSSGVLEDWVNGKLENKLPADIATASGAYSLRKVKASYSGDVVRIRRSSDDVEVDVAFDSDDKVSASSSVTNTTEEGGEIGSTTATDLNGFLNETLTVGTAVGGGSGSDRPDSFTNATNSSFTATVTDIAGGYFPYKTAIGDVITVSFDLELSGGESPSACTSTSISTVTPASNTVVYSTSGSYTNSFTCTADGTHFRFADGDDGTFAVTNFRIVSHTHQAFVHTWYDQAGSNNAVQGTDSSQPQIASSGALLDGIKFNADADGENPDFLETATVLGSSTDCFIATVIGEAQGQIAFGGIITSRSAADEGFAFGLNAAEKAQAFIYSSAGNTNDTSDDIMATPKRLLTLDKDSTTINANVNSSPAFSFTSNTMGSITQDKSFIGVGGRTDSTPTTLGLRANLNELIFYNSDQASNRFLIESEINNYYNLYNDENEWDDSNTEWQNNVQDGVTSSFVSNGKDGFTITATGDNITSFKYRFKSPTTASNDYYKVSFNVDDPNGLFEDAQLRVSATGSGATAQTITNGFNSLSLRTGANFEYMSINSDANGSSKTATLSNFKISRISRDGFVQALYDQSSNNNNATQGTAENQPSIVLNGGIYKDTNDLPSVNFTATSTASGEGRFMTFTKINFSGTLSFFAKHFIRRPSGGGNGRHYSETGGATGGDKSIIIIDTSQYNFFSGDSNIFSGSGMHDANNVQTFLLKNQNKLNVFINGTANSNNEITLSNTISDFELGRIGASAESGSSFEVDMDVSELILYSTDLALDRTDIEQDMKNFYNI